jgi:hypothetical protein
MTKAHSLDFDIVIVGSGSRRVGAKAKTQLVAIPVLDVHAGTHGAQGDEVSEAAKKSAATARLSAGAESLNCQYTECLANT